jgi:hypothetical protein
MSVELGLSLLKMLGYANRSPGMPQPYRQTQEFTQKGQQEDAKSCCPTHLKLKTCSWLASVMRSKEVVSRKPYAASSRLRQRTQGP